MKTVYVNAQKGYGVFIENGLLSRCGEIIKETADARKAAVITDSNVAPLYLGKVTDSLRKIGINPESFIIDAGEKSKDINTLNRILEYLAEKRITRSDLIVSLGGGVCGDIAGFAASVYLRGIKIIHIPTTLLASIDSSVGGKTAINLSAGKNLAGTFKQPEAVICDPETLLTLPRREFVNGMAEAIKYGVLFSDDFFESLATEPTGENICGMIEKCVTFKKAAVEKDEFDNGGRKLLNLGHTIGHAIEKCSGFEISHGFAVAAGMALTARAGEKLGLTNKGTAKKIEAVLTTYSLPTDTVFDASSLAAAAVSDKKTDGEDITLVIPERIGKCVLKKTPISELEYFIEKGKTR